MIKFGYQLYSIGWADASLTDEQSSIIVTASYLSDALRDLLEAVIGVLVGSAETRCGWYQEPGEVRWIFRRQGAEVHLALFRFSYDCPPPEAVGKLIFETTQSLTGLALAIADGALAVLDEHGPDGYLAKWRDHPFPVEQLATIRALLADLA